MHQKPYSVWRWKKQKMQKTYSSKDIFNFPDFRNPKYQKNFCFLYEVITLPFSLSYFGVAKSSLGLK